MVNDMIERVAKAIIAARAGEAAAEYSHRFNNANWREAVRQARASIEAMRELIPVVRDREGYPAHQLVGAPEDIWRTMIDAALDTPSSAATP